MVSRVTADRASQVGVDDRRVRPRHDLDQGRQFRRTRDGLETGLAQDAGRTLFVHRIPVAVHQSHRGGPKALDGERPRSLHQSRLVERQQLATFRVEAAADLDRPFVQGRGPLDVEREDVRPRLVSDQQQIGEALGDEQHCPRTGPLEQRIRSPGRGKPEITGRQRLAQRPAGGDAGGEDGGVLGRHELHDLVPLEDPVIIRCVGAGAPVRATPVCSSAAVPAASTRSAPAGTIRRPLQHARRSTAGERRQVVALEEAVGKIERCRQAQVLRNLRDDRRPDRSGAQDLDALDRAERIDRHAVGERTAGVDPELPEGRHARIRMRKARGAQAPASSRASRSIRWSPSGCSRCARRRSFSAARRSPRRSSTSPSAAAGVASSGPSRRARL